MRALAALGVLMASASVFLSVGLYVQGGIQGRQARRTQCDREPVQRKIAEAAFAVRRSLPLRTRITADELRRFMAQAPKGCPGR